MYCYQILFSYYRNLCTTRVIHSGLRVYVCTLHTLIAVSHLHPVNREPINSSNQTKQSNGNKCIPSLFLFGKCAICILRKIYIRVYTCIYFCGWYYLSNMGVRSSSVLGLFTLFPGKLLPGHRLQWTCSTYCFVILIKVVLIQV